MIQTLTKSQSTYGTKANKVMANVMKYTE